MQTEPGVVKAPTRMQVSNVRPSGPQRHRASMAVLLSFEAVEAEPFRPAAGVVLLRTAVAEEVPVQIREAEVHLDLAAVEAHQQSLHREEVRRLCFCGAAWVRAVLAVGAPRLRPVLRGREPRSQSRFDRSAERLPLRPKPAH
jgi:hypothetical protein